MTTRSDASTRNKSMTSTPDAGPNGAESPRNVGQPTVDAASDPTPLAPGTAPFHASPGTSLARGIPDELALLPPGTTMHEEKLRCGITMRWYERGPRDKPCAILLHGYPEIAMSWKHQLRGLSETHRVVAC